jgi:predicted transcriptional regulator
MKLSEYLKKQGLSQQDLAEMLGITQAAVGRYITKGSIPRRPILRKLAEITGNEVTFQDFYQ